MSGHLRFQQLAQTTRAGACSAGVSPLNLGGRARNVLSKDQESRRGPDPRIKSRLTVSHVPEKRSSRDPPRVYEPIDGPSETPAIRRRHPARSTTEAARRVQDSRTPTGLPTLRRWCTVIRPPAPDQTRSPATSARAVAVATSSMRDALSSCSFWRSSHCLVSAGNSQALQSTPAIETMTAVGNPARRPHRLRRRLWFIVHAGGRPHGTRLVAGMRTCNDRLL